MYILGAKCARNLWGAKCVRDHTFKTVQKNYKRQFGQFERLTRELFCAINT